MKERSSQDSVDDPQDEEKVCMVNLRDDRGKLPWIWHIVNCAVQTQSSKNAPVYCYVRVPQWKLKNNAGMTALHMAAPRKCRGGVVDVLVNNGEDVNATDDFSNTPLTSLVGTVKPKPYVT